MAKVKITGHASGTGILTVTAPNTSTDRTITLPDATGTLAITTDDDDKLPLAGGTMTGDLLITRTVPKFTLTDSDDDSYTRMYHSAGNLFLDVDHGEDVADTYFRISVDDAEKIRILGTGGITFNGDTAAANALDDYEEGTWTPTAQSGLASLTCTGTCAYTKIGNICYINAGIGFGGSGAGSGDVEIGGLPFASVNDSAMRGSISIFAEGLAGNIGQGTSGFVQSNASYIRIRENGTTASGSSMGSKFDTGSGIMVIAHYRVA